MHLLWSQLKGVGLASLLSISVHAVLAFAVMQAPMGWLGAMRQPTEPIAIELFEPPEIEPEPAPEPFPEAPPTPEPPPAEPAAQRLDPRDPPRQEPAPSPEAGPEATADLAPTATGEPQIDVPDVAPDPSARAPDPSDPRIRALIDPRAVARGSFSFTGPGPSQRGPPAPRGLGGRAHGPSEAEIEAQHTDFLRAQAMSKSYTTRTRPQVRRQADGSYAYAGHRFSARIDPDGSVSFADQDNVQTNGFSSSGTFDAMDAIMGASGQDPYRAEREWFMRETEELRHQLESRHRRTQMDGALRRLPARLSRVWATTNRSPAARRRRIFQIWDEMDDEARDARQVVVRFVRETLPEGGEEAYSEAELARLNASRESAQAFNPY